MNKSVSEISNLAGREAYELIKVMSEDDLIEYMQCLDYLRMYACDEDNESYFGNVRPYVEAVFRKYGLDSKSFYVTVISSYLAKAAQEDVMRKLVAESCPTGYEYFKYKISDLSLDLEFLQSVLENNGVELVSKWCGVIRQQWTRYLARFEDFGMFSIPTQEDFESFLSEGFDYTELPKPLPAIPMTSDVLVDLSLAA